MTDGETLTVFAHLALNIPHEQLYGMGATMSAVHPLENGSSPVNSISSGVHGKGSELLSWMMGLSFRVPDPF